MLPRPELAKGDNGVAMYANHPLAYVKSIDTRRTLQTYRVFCAADAIEEL
jgi:hypothetical protein